MSRPLFSVLLPVRNGAAYVGEAVRSILKQTEGRLELLLLDDGSTDGSLLVAQKAARGDARFKAVKLKGGGLVAALNRGLVLARGAYIARMDADDVAVPRRLAWQLAAFQADPGLGVVGGDLRVLGRRFKHFRLPKAHADILVGALFDNPVAHPAVAFKAALAKEHGGYRAAYRHAEDYELWSRWMLKGVRFKGLDRVLLHYRVHPGQVTQTKQADLKKVVRRLRQSWFKALGLRASDQELALHDRIAQGDWPRGLQGLQAMERWFLRLLQANEKAGLLDAGALGAALASFWQRALWANRGGGAPLRSLARGSQLGHLRHRSLWKPWVARLGLHLP